MLALAWLVACSGRWGEGGGAWATEPHVSDDLNGWSANGVWMTGVRAGALSANPDVWTDGSLVRDKFSDICCGGAGVFAFCSGANWFHRSGGHLELLPPDLDTGSERSMLFFLST